VTDRNPPSLLALASVFFRIGMFSFGGGLSGWMYREVVQARGWLTEDEFLSGMAVGQILPGANVANLTIYIGHRLKGPLGAAAALVALLAVPFFAVIALAGGYGLIKNIPYAQTGLEGVAAAAIGLLLVVVARGARDRKSTRLNSSHETMA
jgi:chromate transporter